MSRSLTMPSITFKFKDQEQIGYHKLYGIPDGVVAETTNSIPASQNSSPEYAYVPDNGYYRKCVLFGVNESLCEIKVLVDGIESSEWQLQEDTLSSFLEFKKNGSILEIYAKRNRTGYERSRELLIKSTSDIFSYSSILIVQKEGDCDIELENSVNRTVPMGTLLNANPYTPQVINPPIRVICTGGSRDFVIKNITTRTYYGDVITAYDIPDDEMKLNTAMRGSGWKQGYPQYVKYYDNYFQHYIRINNDNTIDNNYSIFNAEPCIANNDNVMRFTDGKFGNDIVVKKSKNELGDTFLNITNLGRLWNNHDNTIFKVYIITLCHMDDYSKTLGIKAYYQN